MHKPTAGSAGSSDAASDASAAASAAAPLAGVLVAEYGERLGAAICGSLLHQLGAEVVRVERAAAQDAITRACRVGSKRSIVIRDDDAADARLLRDLLGGADVVVLSSDLSPPPQFEPAYSQIVCDVTAFGASGPLAGLPYSDALVQALAGLADTTGEAGGAPTLIGFPFCEVAAGIYAAAAIVVAHRVRRTRGFGQRVEAALLDCAVSALSTFLPFHAIGKPVTRAGNRHSLAAPWNAYRAADGWVLICTATDQQWRRLCGLIGSSGLWDAAGYATNAERVARRSDVDALVARWTVELTVEECVQRLSSIDIACGPILTLEQLRSEPNLARRRMVRRVHDRHTGAWVTLPGNPLPFSRMAAPDREDVTVPDADRDYICALLAQRKSVHSPARSADTTPALAGLRVVEIGQYTTAPLVARQLGALGAEVFKIEPPGGEGSRAWPPTQGNRGYFFAFSNSDKKSLELDLRDDSQRAAFRALLRTADVLVENLKPGSLARLGFGRGELHAINPRLVYCGISGFGAVSAYPGRPAFDTVVQAMSGIMDATRTDGVPMKAGISAADIMGGELALLAILAALEMRDHTGSGQALDISMQDAAVWATTSLWSTPSRTSSAQLVKCSDGYVCVEHLPERQRAVVGMSTAGTTPVAHASRAAFAEAARRAGLAAAPVLSVSEVADSEQIKLRRLIVEKSGEDGRVWPLLNSPLRLERTPAEVKRPIGELGEANRELTAMAAGSVRHW